MLIPQCFTGRNPWQPLAQQERKKMVGCYADFLLFFNSYQAMKGFRLTCPCLFSFFVVWSRGNTEENPSPQGRYRNNCCQPRRFVYSWAILYWQVLVVKHIFSLIFLKVYQSGQLWTIQRRFNILVWFISWRQKLAAPFETLIRRYHFSFSSAVSSFFVL